MVVERHECQSRDPGYWDRVARSWRSNPRQHLWRSHSDAVNRELVRRCLGSESGRVLKTDLFDEAVAEGILQAVVAPGGVAVGVDVSRETARGARRGPVDVAAVVADVRALPFRGGSFDAIVSISTLDHLETRSEIEAAIEALASVLTPGGRFVITLDNPWNPMVALRNALPDSWLRISGLVPYYVGATLGPRALRTTVQGVGLEVLATDAVLHVPRAPAVFLARWLERTAGEAAARRFRWLAGRFELLRRLPTRYLTGYYVTLLAAAPER